MMMIYFDMNSLVWGHKEMRLEISLQHALSKFEESLMFLMRNIKTH